MLMILIIYIKKEGVCVYHKETLAIHFVQTNLEQCIVSEVTSKDKKKGHIISLYRSPSQTPDQFDNFQCCIQSYFEASIPVWDPKLKPPNAQKC